jgi:hypothetical protein
VRVEGLGEGLGAGDVGGFVDAGEDALPSLFEDRRARRLDRPVVPTANGFDRTTFRVRKRSRSKRLLSRSSRSTFASSASIRALASAPELASGLVPGKSAVSIACKAFVSSW